MDIVAAMKFEKVKILFFFSLVSLIFASTMVAPAFADAAPTVKITSPTNGTIVKGVLTLTASVAADPAGTATLAKAGLAIVGAPNYYAAYLNGQSPYGVGGGDFGPLGYSDYYWITTQNAYTFTFDTTTWQAGSYKLTIFTEDTNGLSSSSAITVTFANGAPVLTIISPSNNTVVKGKVTLTATATADPAGTATLARAGLAIVGAHNYAPYLNGQSPYGVGGGDFGSVGSSDSVWSTTQNSYTFTFDTSDWQAGSYKVTVFTEDNSGRASATTISITVPALPTLTLSRYKTSGQTSILRTEVSGTSSLYSGNVVLESGAGSKGPWTSEGTFTGSIDSLVASSNLPFGTWVRASLNGVAELLDSVSDPIQLIGQPTIQCTLPSTGKANVVLRGKCNSDISLGGTRVTLQTNFGSGWINLGDSTVSGTSFPISITVKKAGTLSIRIVSNARSGLLSPSVSKISKVIVKSR